MSRKVKEHAENSGRTMVNLMDCRHLFTDWTSIFDYYKQWKQMDANTKDIVGLLHKIETQTDQPLPPPSNETENLPEKKQQRPWIPPWFPNFPTTEELILLEKQREQQNDENAPPIIQPVVDYASQKRKKNINPFLFVEDEEVLVGTLPQNHPVQKMKEIEMTADSPDIIGPEVIFSEDQVQLLNRHLQKEKKEISKPNPDNFIDMTL